MSVCSFSFEAIGTHWQIDITDEVPLESRTPLLNEIQDRIAQFDREYSRFRDDSHMMEMGKTIGTHTLAEDAKPLFDLYQKLYQLTEGAFTPLIGQTLIDAGYDQEYSLKPKTLRTPGAWDTVLHYAYPKLEVKKAAVIDIGAAGKGYIVDLISTLLTEKGYASFCVDAGGDLQYRNASGMKLRVGLENPTNIDEVVGVAEICDQSICGSSGNRRTWGKYHHIIDPRTLRSPENILATWVVADTTIIADGVATALFLVPAQKLFADFTFEYALIYKDRSLETSAKFPGEFFTP